MKALHIVTYILIIVGALNWGILGLTALFGNPFNLVDAIFGSAPVLEDVIYVLVGLSAIFDLCVHKKMCACCSGNGAKPMM